MGLSGQVSLITGGSRGIGRAVCLEVARQGADVAFSYRSQETPARETEAALQALGVRTLRCRADVSDPKAVDDMVAEVLSAFGRIDFLVHSAGARAAWKPIREPSSRICMLAAAGSSSPSPPSRRKCVRRAMRKGLRPRRAWRP